MSRRLTPGQAGSKVNGAAATLSRVYVSDIAVWRTVKPAAWIWPRAGIRPPEHSQISPGCRRAMPTEPHPFRMGHAGARDERLRRCRPRCQYLSVWRYVGCGDRFHLLGRSVRRQAPHPDGISAQLELFRSQSLCRIDRIRRQCGRMRINEPHQTGTKENSHSRRSDDPKRDEVEHGSKILFRYPSHHRIPLRTFAVIGQRNAMGDRSLTSISRPSCHRPEALCQLRPSS